MNNHTEEQLLRKMIEFLAQEAGESLEVEGKTVEELKAKWRGLVNIRQPKVAPAEYVTLENEYLKEYHAPRVQILADCVPTLLFAKWFFTTWYTTCSLISAPNKFSESSISLTFSPFILSTSTVGMFLSSFPSIIVL